MPYSQEFIDKVRDANNIVDIFSEYTQLKRSGGGRLMGLCPFPGHNEKSPSFSVSEDKQVYYCFGCQRSGQIFIALKELRGLSFPEAVEYLANRAGIMLPHESQRTRPNLEQKSRRENLLKVNNFAAQLYHQQLMRLEVDHYAKRYCLKRGLSKEIIQQFHIGFADNAWDLLVKKLAAAQAPLDFAAELGLIKLRKDGDGYFDLFRDRLIFPIYSHKGECVGFGGRAFTDEQMPKYLNSHESEIFSKGQTFYGLNETAKYIRAEGAAIVVEGYMDFLALYAAGIKNVVATLGTALTTAHAKLLKRYTTNVTILFDGDQAGQNAAQRSLPILLAEELLPKAVSLQDELDPDEYIKERGVDALKEHLKSAPDLYSVILDRHLLNYRGSSADKIILMDHVAEYIRATADKRLRDLYISETAQKIGVEAVWVQRHMTGTSVGAGGHHGHFATAEGQEKAKEAENRQVKAPITVPGHAQVLAEGPKIQLKGISKAELFLLNIALMSPERLNLIADEPIMGQFLHEGVKAMLDLAKANYRQMPSEFAKLSAYLMSFTEHPQALGLHLGEPICSMSTEALDKLMDDCVRQVKERFLRNQTRELTASLRSLPAEDRMKKLEQIMNIQKTKQTLRRDREPQT